MKRSIPIKVQRAQGSRSKYRAVRTTIGDLTFDSKREAGHWQTLAWRQEAKQISELKCQPRFPIVVNGKRICDYLADFSYQEEGKFRVIDVKGVRTPVYRLKRKLVEALYGIEITEV